MEFFNDLISLSKVFTFSSQFFISSPRLLANDFSFSFSARKPPTSTNLPLKSSCKRLYCSLSSLKRESGTPFLKINNIEWKTYVKMYYTQATGGGQTCGEQGGGGHGGGEQGGEAASIFL